MHKFDGRHRHSYEVQPTEQRCGNEQGFSLHAKVGCATYQRHKLEQLCCYLTRPAIANERLQLDRTGDVVLQLKSPDQDGTTHIVMSPLEFRQRLAALVPLPRFNLVRSHGVLAPNAKLRPPIIPGRAVTANNTADDPDRAPHHVRSAHMSWTRLLTKPPGAVLNGERRPEGREPGRVFVDGYSDIDIDHCPHCGGNLKIIAAIEDPAVITMILAHLGLPTRTLPRAPARSFARLETA